MFEENSDEEPEPLEIKKPPPATLNDWLAGNNLGDWPLDVEDEIDESDLHLSADHLGLGTKDDIRNEIKKQAPFQTGILDELLEKLLSIEEKVSDYASYFFGEPKKKRNAVTYDNEKCRASVDIALDQDSQRHEKIKEMFSFKLKNFEHSVFPGYFDHEITPLPSCLEAPQLLNHVIRLKGFNTCVRKIWMKYSLSEPSVAIIQDAFWWMFLEHKDQKDGEIQAKLFNRMSSSFVSLFLSVPNTEKDLFFKFYPDCVSQAIYAGFCAAFEASAVKFNEQFRRDLLVLLYEWVTGTHPHIEEILRHWNLEALESKTRKDNGDDKGYVIKASLSFDENTFLDVSPRKTCFEDDMGLNLFSPKQIKNIAQSHPAGPGPSYDKISFNIHGHSPFILHYLASKNLQREEEVLKKIVTRTQINEKYFKTQDTYEDLIAKHKRKNTTRNVIYKNVTGQMSKECQNLEKRKRRDIKKMQKQHVEFLKRQVDVKILSQKILNKMDKSSFTPRKVSNEITDNQKDDEKEETHELCEQ